MTNPEIISDLELVLGIMRSSHASQVHQDSCAGILREIAAAIDAERMTRPKPLPSGVRVKSGLNAGPKRSSAKCEAGGETGSSYITEH